jgi:hypothetical protein
MELIVSGPFLSLPSELDGGQWIVDGELSGRFSLLFLAQEKDSQKDEQLRDALQAAPELETCEEVWFLHFWGREKPAWPEFIAGQANDQPVVRRFRPTARVVWAVDRDGGTGAGDYFFVYPSAEDAWSDLAGSFPRIRLLRELTQQVGEVTGRLASSVLEGDDAAVAILADALEEAGDERSVLVRAWNVQ